MATADEPRLAEPDADRIDSLQIQAHPIALTPGREGTHFEPGIYKGRSMAVFTSGGDSSG